MPTHTMSELMVQVELLTAVINKLKSERDRLRARLADVEADVERATLATARLWSNLSKLRKEVE